MEDEFAPFAPSLNSPANAAEVIVPSDSASLSYVTRAIYVGSAGTIVARFQSGDVITLTSMQAGLIYPLRLDRILATGTTASGLIGLR